MGRETLNQAHPIELPGSFLGIAVGEYQHSDDHREPARAVPWTRELAALLEGFGYRPTVLENPTIGELRTGLREWRQRPAAAQSPVLLAWSGRATAVGDVLRLAAHDTSAAFEPDCSYRPESLVEKRAGQRRRPDPAAHRHLPGRPGRGARGARRAR